MLIPPEDTIVAISTPMGSGAIGVIRLSGPQAKSILEMVWQGKVAVSDFVPSRVYDGVICGGENFLDQVLVFWRKTPYSYTGEDIVEVQAHGGRVILDGILSRLVKSGARMAEPGEFTKRAFLNGKMDLVQAEAVADLIHASSLKAVALANRQKEGYLSEDIQVLRNEVKVIKAQIEARIDFPEDEDVQGLDYGEVIERSERIREKVIKLVKSYKEGRILREGLRVALVGKPNVGKSSFFNALLDQDRSIVHMTPGTTRDLVEESIDLKGLIVRFIDTAGIRSSDSPIEVEGIQRTRQRAQQADLILVLLDASVSLDQEDAQVFELVRGKEVIYLYNKIDLKPAFSMDNLRKRIDASSATIFPVSAKEKMGLEPFKDFLVSHFMREEVFENQDPILMNRRHCLVLERGNEALQNVVKCCEEKRSLDLLASDLQLVLQTLEEMTGEITNEEVLSEIFSKFCIGK